MEQILFHNNGETHTHSRTPVNSNPFHKLIHQSQINYDTFIFPFTGIGLITDSLKFYESNYAGIINNKMFYNIISPKAFIINSSLLI